MSTDCTQAPLTRPTVAAPMNQPIALGSTSTGGELESARQQLLGTWELIALESAKDDGPRAPVRATGTLTYDQYGNLTIEARTTDAAAPAAALEVDRLSFKGRAVIDVAKSELKLMDLLGNVDPNEVLNPERRRRFSVEHEILTLSSFDDHERITAISTWRRQQ